MSSISLSANGVLSHETVDNAVKTYLSGGYYGKNLFYDPLGDSLASEWNEGSASDPSQENGSNTESGGKDSISTSSVAGAPKRYGIYTDAVYDGDFDCHIDVENFNVTDGDDERGFVILICYIDANNYYYVYRLRRPEAPADFVAFVVYQNGVQRVNTQVNTAATDFSMRIKRDGNDYYGYYATGGGWNLIDSVSTGDVGNNGYCEINAWNDTDSGTSTTTCDITDFTVDTGSYYFSTGEVQLNSVSVSAGSTVDFATFNPTETGTVTYDLKIGSGAWQNGLTKAQVIALGEQTTDDGSLRLHINLADGTGSNSTVEDATLSVDYQEAGNVAVKSHYYRMMRAA